ncbi:MAG TPA: hypothetical protein VHU13_01280 [Solirubrobacteraceae bacterium]|nr:hypothetical protein [Solirubrobacteraceae bacterium]
MQTERDGQIVDWIGRLGAAGAEHVMRRFATSRSVAYGRLRSLVRDGLLDHRAVLYARPGMYTASTAGLRWQGNQRLGGCSLGPGGFEHAWQLAQVAVWLELALPGWRTVSEREIRAVEAAEERPFASARVGTIADRATWHRPDLALSDLQGRTVAVEVELSIKSAARLAAICRGWARARHVHHVYYLATAGPARAVARTVRAIQATDYITVLGLDGVPRLAAELEPQSSLHA